MFGVNPYSPYGYGYGAMEPMTAPVQGGTQAPRPQMQQGGGPDWIMVQNTRQVEQVNVQPGGKAWVMVQNEPVFALRTADQMGLVTTNFYRFEKFDPETATPAAVPDYITREDLEKRLETLVEELKGATK